MPTVSSEDLAGPCNYELFLPTPSVQQAGTIVIFGRGDSERVYKDRGLRTLAAKLHYAMVWAAECNARSTKDLQADASLGPARTLFAALSQFASNTNHPELSTVGVVLYGFSAAGVLSATMENLEPERVIASVEFAPGDAYLYLPTLPISAAAAQIPTLILDNAEDPYVGTTMGLEYFRRGRALNAPWAFGVQNATNHCCNTSTLPLVEPWLSAIAAVAALPASSQVQTQSRFAFEQFGSFTCTADRIVDNLGFVNCAISSPSVAAQAPATGDVGWLPDAATASAWTTWVTNPVTN